MLSSLLRFCDHIIYVLLNGPSYLFFEQPVHHMLVCGTCIFESEWHYLIAIEALSGDEASLVLIRRVHRDLIIPRESIHEA